MIGLKNKAEITLTRSRTQYSGIPVCNRYTISALQTLPYKKEIGLIYHILSQSQQKIHKYLIWINFGEKIIVYKKFFLTRIQNVKNLKS